MYPFRVIVGPSLGLILRHYENRSSAVAQSPDIYFLYASANFFESILSKFLLNSLKSLSLENISQVVFLPALIFLCNIFFSCSLAAFFSLIG